MKTIELKDLETDKLLDELQSRCADLLVARHGMMRRPETDKDSVEALLDYINIKVSIVDTVIVLPCDADCLITLFNGLQICKDDFYGGDSNGNEVCTMRE